MQLKTYPLLIVVTLIFLGNSISAIAGCAVLIRQIGCESLKKRFPVEYEKCCIQKESNQPSTPDLGYGLTDLDPNKIPNLLNAPNSCDHISLNQPLPPNSIINENSAEKPKEIFGQRLLIDHISSYLEHELKTLTLENKISEREIKNRQEVINLFKASEGECAGLSMLWAYGRRISEEPLKDSTKERDDNRAFEEAQHLLGTWNEKTTYTKDEKLKIDRFISQIFTFQSPHLVYSANDLNLHTRQNQFDLAPQHFQDTLGRTLQNDIIETLIGDSKMLASRLEKLIQPKRMFFLSSHGHSMAIYKSAKNGQLYFYDPNRGETRPADVKGLVSDFQLNMHALASAERGFSHLDRITGNIARVRVQSFKFSDEKDSEENKTARKLSSDELALSYKELLEILKNSPKILERRNEPSVKGLFSSLSKEQLIHALEKPPLDSRLKEALEEAAKKVSFYDAIHLIWWKKFSETDEDFIKSALTHCHYPNGNSRSLDESDRAELLKFIGSQFYLGKSDKHLKTNKLVLELLKDKLHSDYSDHYYDTKFESFQKSLLKKDLTPVELENLIQDGMYLLHRQVPPSAGH